MDQVPSSAIRPASQNLGHTVGRSCPALAYHRFFTTSPSQWARGCGGELKASRKGSKPKAPAQSGRRTGRRPIADPPRRFVLATCPTAPPVAGALAGGGRDGLRRRALPPSAPDRAELIGGPCFVGVVQLLWDTKQILLAFAGHSGTALSTERSHVDHGTRRLVTSKP
jgi:hypothetical protein